MWIWLTIVSALFLGLYDVAKKQSLKKNSVLYILFFSTLITSVILAPWLRFGPGTDHLALVLKAFLVTASWISGLAALELLPLTTVSTIKASRPVFVLLMSMIIFGERLNIWQWAGSILAIVALYMLSRSSKQEGIPFKNNKGILYIIISVATGVASALYDKHILGHMDPMFVQSWTNVYITVLMGACLLFQKHRQGEKFQKFTWDWNILLIAVFITIADNVYFWALTIDGALLSVISMVRRSSVIVPFIFGALLFHEKNIKGKAIDLAILLAGMCLIVFGSV